MLAVPLNMEERTTRLEEPDQDRTEEGTQASLEEADRGRGEEGDLVRLTEAGEGHVAEEAGRGRAEGVSDHRMMASAGLVTGTVSSAASSIGPGAAQSAGQANLLARAWSAGRRSFDSFHPLGREPGGPSTL